MSVFLIILNCIGAILLFLLAVVLFIVIVPHVFNLKINRNETLTAHFELRSVLSFLRICVDYDGEFHYSIGLIWRALVLGSPKPKEKHDDNKKKKEKKQRSFDDIISLILKSRDAVYVVLDTLFKLIKKIRLHIDSADFSFSSGECDKTALYYGLLMCIPGALDKNIKINPDIENENFYIDGYINIKGYISVLILIIYIFKLLGNESIKRLIR